MKRRKRNLILLGAAGVISAAAIAVSVSQPSCTTITGGDKLTVAMAKLAPGTASFFCYRDEAGDHLRFVLARDESGQVHSILDGCRQCGKFHKGYATADGELICRVCGNKYKLADVERGEGSCVPVALPSKQSHDHIEIKVADLKQASQQF
ncbi:MAG TPA: Fe-S-containing protein [Candidatus Binataceae bacterium]|nr:Fe-S-containing protein [Candidatus Binataceae bacterium]